MDFSVMSIPELVLWFTMMFCTGLALATGAYVGWSIVSDGPDNMVKKVVRFILRPYIHQQGKQGLTKASHQEFSGLFMRKKDVVPAADVDRLVDEENDIYVGDCACGCSQPVYYKGYGRPPKYVNLKHKNYAHGLRPEAGWE